MKKLIIANLFVVFFTFSLFSQEIVLEGTYQGDNLFVKNPFAASGVGFCVYEVTVNGSTSTDEINSSAFEIDLSTYGFHIGEPISVVVRYKNNCSPLVLNPEVLKARATFEVQKLEVKDNKIYWTTIKEAGSLPFTVEQYRWNKWIEAARISGKGESSATSYSASVRLHSGENRFRIKQVDYTGKPKYSDEIVVMSSKDQVDFSPARVDDEITFSAPTMYEIYDEFGGIIFKGYGDKVNVAGIEKGKYYLNLDNRLETFVKK